MRPTARQGTARAASEEMSMQQVMEMMRGLQDEMAESRVEQERMQADLADSRARNKELHRVNEELRRGNVNKMRPSISPHQGSFPHPARRRSWMQ